MSTEWLTAQSFQYDQDLLSAINTLSIHKKLRLTGIPDKGRADAAERAKSTIATFLGELEGILREVTAGEKKAVLGTGIRRRELAESFVEAQRHGRRFRSVLFRKNPSDVAILLNSDREEDQRSLLQCLMELRELVEKHVHTDATRILGEI